jgi:hypothetical protein
MPLISCPACGHQISTEAEACPQCGHPNHPKAEAPAGPQCYACSATATTKCANCGKLSCASHVYNVYVSHGEGGANELRCDACYASATSAAKMRRFAAVVILAVGFSVLVLFSAHAWGCR